MPHDIYAILVDKGIMFVAGVFTTLYGMGGIGPKLKKGPEAITQRQRLAAIGVWAGPALIAISVILLMVDLMSALK